MCGTLGTSDSINRTDRIPPALNPIKRRIEMRMKKPAQKTPHFLGNIEFFLDIGAEAPFEGGFDSAAPVHSIHGTKPSQLRCALTQSVSEVWESWYF